MWKLSETRQRSVSTLTVGFLGFTQGSIACLVEDPTSKRQTPRNYLQSLEERVAMLEGMLQQVRPEVANDHFSSSDNFNTSASFSQETQFSSFSAITEAPDETDELSSKIGLLALNAPGTEPHYFGSSSAFAFSRVINASLRRLGEKEGGVQTSGMPGGSTQTVLPCPMPSPDVGSLLSQAYFDHVHTQYPFLHEPTWRSWEENIMGNLDDVRVDPVGCFFVNIVSILIVGQRH